MGEGKPGLAAAEEAFGDLETLNAELYKYKSSNMPALRVAPANYKMPEVKTRPLGAVEEKYIQKRILLSRGVSREQARKISAELAPAAAAETGNLPLQLLAAEAGLDALDHAAGTAAADRALAIDPNSIDALIFKARALIEPKNGPADRFKQARLLLVRARNIDKNDPRPLIEFYSSYRRAPERPIPDAAAAALDSAYDLARHDSYFRLLLTRQLLEEARPAQAIQVLGPLAFSFDGRNQDRNFAGKAMAKLQANDTAAALEILNGELLKIEDPDAAKEKEKEKEKGGK